MSVVQAIAFVLTLTIEIPVAALYWRVRRLVRLDVRLGRLLLASFAGTAVSHPIVWWLATELKPWPYWDRVAVVEPLAVAIEVVVYALVGRLGWRDALVLSLIANAISFAAGLVFGEQIFDLARAIRSAM